MHRGAVRAGEREVMEFHLIHELVDILFDSANEGKKYFVKKGLIKLLMRAYGF